MITVKEDKFTGDIFDDLSKVCLAEFLARDSLSREIPQFILIQIEVLVKHLTSSIYGILLNCLLKNDEAIKEHKKNMENIFNDLNGAEDKFYKKPHNTNNSNGSKETMQ